MRVGLNATWRRLRLFAQAQDVRNLGDTLPGNDGGNFFGVHQGFAEVGFDQGYVRVGRQEIAYGSERFLGPLDWASSARSFDGARVHINPIHKIEFDAFGAILRGENVFVVGTPPSTTVGDYFVASQLAYLHSPALRIEANYFYRHDGPTAALPMRLRNIHAPTIRLSGNVKEGLVRYDLEGMVQLGDQNGQDHFAYAFAGDVFVRLGEASRPTLDGGFSYATGASADGDVDELDNFFPTNHKLYGYMDLFGLRNVISGHIGLTHRIQSANLLLGVRAWEAFLQTTNGNARWSNAVGQTLGTGQGGSRHLGTEVDFWATYKPYQFLGFTAGYSIFAPGAAADSMGHGDAQHWIWLQLDVTTN